MRALILDTETTGLSPQQNQAIEVAVVLFDTEFNASVATFATLIEAESNDAEHINKIPVSLLKDAMEAGPAWSRVSELVEAADCIVAHNASFDRSFTPSHIAEMRPWVCSLHDIKWPESSSSKQLSSIAITHGVPVLGAHRALTDVDILVRLFQRLGERGIDVGGLLQAALKARVPKALIQAVVSFDDKDKAKAAGFRWNAPVRRWEARMTLEDAKKLPFKTKILEAAE
jgi:DNA polymerase-3 subunit epsilon